MSNNDIHIVGNLCADPELRYTTGGRAVVNLRVAVNEDFQRNGQWEKRTNFFNVVAWNGLAENIAMSLSTGDRVMVGGRINQRVSEPEPGVKHYWTEIIAADLGVALRWAAVGYIEKTAGDTGGGTTTPAGEPFPTDTATQDADLEPAA